MVKRLAFNNVLQLFPPGDFTVDNNHCNVCDEFGACRDWLETMANDSGVSLSWLAYEVYKGFINHDWSTFQVREAYENMVDGKEYLREVHKILDKWTKSANVSD